MYFRFVQFVNIFIQDIMQRNIWFLKMLAQLLFDALPMVEQLNDLATPAVDRNLSQLPELNDVAARRRVVDMLGR